MLECSSDMGEEDQGGLPNLDPKSRSGFFNLPDLSRPFKKFEVSREQSGLSLIFPDFPRFIPISSIYPDFPQFFPIFSDLKWPGKIEENLG